MNRFMYTQMKQVNDSYSYDYNLIKPGYGGFVEKLHPREWDHSYK